MKLSDDELNRLLRRLHLAHTRRTWRQLADQAERERWSFRDFFSVRMAEEVAARQQTGIQNRTRRARFPFLKTVDEFDFTYQSTLRLTMIGSYLSADFVTEGRNLILHGKT